MTTIITTQKVKTVLPGNGKANHSNPALENSTLFLKPVNKLQKHYEATGNRIKGRFSFFHRISPFMFLATALIVLIPKQYIDSIKDLYSGVLYSLLFLSIILNILLADFALWNYFKGGKRAIAWLVEIVISATIMYVLV